ncbi:hypothetical protein GYA37_00080 [candidate division WWE3 bacterium]|uniref:Uncharacterized protein n=1 Tax=candidate division WWE3 bacterium TaxID=2053526 RepID=A0A7X9E695_UNCKA|nr:hypothetical protein [candidate division WWE3 bacterium]
MLSSDLLLELKQIFNHKFKVVISDKDLANFGEFLVSYFILLTGVNDE